MPIITETILEKLCGKSWYGTNVIEYRREDKYEYMSRGKIEFKSNKEFVLYSDTGSWDIINDQTIIISIDNKSYNGNNNINGPFSIYELTDSVLVLGRVLISSGDFKKEYHFSKSGKVSPTIQRYLNYSALDFFYPKRKLNDGKYIYYYEEGKIKSIKYYQFRKTKGE